MLHMRLARCGLDAHRAGRAGGEAWLLAVLVAAGCPPVGDLGVYTESDPLTGTSAADTGSTVTAVVTSGAAGSTANDPDSSGNPGSSSSADPGTTAALDESTGTGAGGSTSTGPDSTSSSSGGAESTTSGGIEAVCGDLAVDPPEQCDDGNGDEWDGCLSNCSFGPGKKVMTLPVPDALPGEELYYAATVKDQFTDNNLHALMLGGWVPNFSPDQQQAAHIQQVPIPDGGAATWAYLEYAGMYGRRPGPMATAANGDIVVAGMVYTEDVNVDTGGYLWLARFAPNGALVWSHELPEVHNQTQEIALTPAGDIVIVGRQAGFSLYPPDLRVFGPDGSPLWMHTEPASGDYASDYTGLAVDDDGNIYVSGHQHDYDEVEVRTMLRAFTSAGGPLWATEHVAPKYMYTFGQGLIWTDDDVLLMSGAQYIDAALDEIALAAFDTSGGLMWWNYWTPKPTWRVRPLTIGAAPNGGLFIGGYGLNDGQPPISVVARFDAQGELLWTRDEPGQRVEDLLLGPTGFLYVVKRDGVAVYLP